MDKNSSFRSTNNYLLALEPGSYVVSVGYNPAQAPTELNTVKASWSYDPRIVWVSAVWEQDHAHPVTGVRRARLNQRARRTGTAVRPDFEHSGVFSESARGADWCRESVRFERARPAERARSSETDTLDVPGLRLREESHNDTRR